LKLVVVLFHKIFIYFTGCLILYFFDSYKLNHRIIAASFVKKGSHTAQAIRPNLGRMAFSFIIKELD